MIKTIELTQQINIKLRQFKTSIDVIIKQNDEYVNSVKRYENKEFELDEKSNETLEERKNKTETMLDQLEDIKKRNEIEIQNIELFENNIIRIIIEIEELKSRHLYDQEKCENKISEIEKEIFNSIEAMKENKMKEIDEEMERLTVENKYNQMRKQNYSSNLFSMIDFEEINQLEEWTGKKCGEIIFDSNKDNFWEYSSVFDSKIIEKSHFVIIIEDEEDNKFGYYTPKKIEQIEKYYNDRNAFLFSLKSNGRLKGMMKFESLKSDNGIKVKDNGSSYLFGIYDGFWIYKTNCKNNSNCVENYSDKSYDFHDQQYPLIGKPGKSAFTPRRITVIQMI